MSDEQKDDQEIIFISGASDILRELHESCPGDCLNCSEGLKQKCVISMRYVYQIQQAEIEMLKAKLDLLSGVMINSGITTKEHLEELEKIKKDILAHEEAEKIEEEKLPDFYGS